MLKDVIGTQLQKKDVASSQLNWAIRLILDFQAYIPAITLAGAAEEILSKTLGKNTSQNVLIKRLSELTTESDKTLSDEYLNKAKNLFKHWPSKNEVETLELQTESLQYVMRALSNMISFDQSLPAEGPRFMDWLTSNRADLLSENFVKEWQDTRSRLNC
jgi:hypothetical protein